MKAYPQIAGLPQQASNTGGQLARAEGELQLGRRMFNVWTQLVKLPGKDIPFKTVKSLLLRSKPQCATSIPYLWAYLMKFGGGQDARHFFELAEFVNVWGCTQRTSLGSEVWDLLSQDCKVPGESCNLAFALCPYRPEVSDIGRHQTHLQPRHGFQDG